MLHGPHDVGEALAGGLVEEELHLRVSLGEGGQGGHRQGDHLGVLHGLDEHVKDDGVHQAGGGHDASVAPLHPVEGDLPPLLREKVGPELAGEDQHDPLTVLVGPVGDGSLGNGRGDGGVQEQLLLLGGEALPEGEGFGQQSIQWDHGMPPITINLDRKVGQPVRLPFRLMPKLQ